MKFDKSKVCVAGLHEVKKGTRGWLSDYVRQLKDAVENDMIDIIKYCKESKELGYAEEESSYLWQFFYPAPEKQYRPFETMEEAKVMKGKWIQNKDYAELVMVTKINFGALSGMLLINGHTTESLFNDFVIDETGEPVGVEV